MCLSKLYWYVIIFRKYAITNLPSEVGKSCFLSIYFTDRLSYPFSGMLKMPFNSVSETKKRNEKVKLSFSLKKNNAPHLGNENTILKVKDNSENTFSSRQEFCSDKENRPAKRPFSSTYMNTLNNSKKLKAVTGTSNSTSEL